MKMCKNNYKTERLNTYITHWNLIPDGKYFQTKSSILFPCIYQGKQAILKCFLSDEESQGAELMRWWNGIGVAEVYQLNSNAILMERIEGTAPSLTKLSKGEKDEKATRIICRTVEQLHTLQSENELPKLTNLDIWFKSLLATDHHINDILAQCARYANNLLKTQRDICVLHGDIHHQNILFSDSRGWLAIDPKGLYGERTFDFANILCNPDVKVALSEGRLKKQIEIICAETKISEERLLSWTIAWTGLSAIWMIEENENPFLPIEVAKLALKEIQQK